MYCIECGQAQPVKEAQFCPFCGTAVHRPDASGTQALWQPPLPDGEPANALHGADLVQVSADSKVPAPAPNPLQVASAVILDPSQWVPLRSRTEELRTRLRWAIRVALALVLIFAGVGAWWWIHQAPEATEEEGVQVERVEGAPKQPS